MVEILRLTAFASAPEGGNPAGVILDADGLTATEMLAIAAKIGYPESAFVPRFPADAPERRVPIRYFSPIAEVPFCGHATVATAVVLAEKYGAGPFIFETPVGDVVLETILGATGVTASFTSVEPAVSEISEADLAELLGLLALRSSDLSKTYPAKISFAGNPHPIIVLADQRVFDTFSFDPKAVRDLMDRRGWTGTVTILHVLSDHEFEARNLFPVGTVVEDPATGSAAASVGAYLRELAKVGVPTDVVIHQGRHVGKPSLLRVHIPVQGGITVSGSASHLPG